MRRLVPTLLLALILWTSPATAEVAADQIVLEKSVTIRLQADGRRSLRVRTERELVTDFAVRRLSDPRIRYDEDLQDLIIHEHLVRTPGGGEVKAPDYARNLSQADGLGRTTDFASTVELVATQVGSQRGAVLVLDYEITDRAAFRPALDMALPLDEDGPVKRLKVTVAVPAGAPLHWALSPDAGSLRAEKPVTIQGERVLEIIGTDLPAAIHEAGGLNQGPRLLISTWKGWPEAVEHLGSLLDTAFAGRGDCDLHGALSAASNLPGVPGALAAVRDGLRILHGVHEGGRLHPRPVCRVWESGYATPLESVLVLAAAFGDDDEAAALLSTGDAPLALGVPGLSQLTGITARVEGAEEASLFWSPASDTLRGRETSPAGAGLIVHDLLHPASGPDAVEITEQRPSKVRPCWGLDEERTYTLGPDGDLTLSVVFTVTGRPDLWLVLATAKDLEKALTTKLTPLLPGAEVENLAVMALAPTRLSLKATLRGKAGADILATIPMATVLRAPENLVGLILPGHRRGTMRLPLCGEVTQRLRFEGLMAAGPVPREVSPAPEDPDYPVVRSRWTDARTFVRTLRSAEALVSPTDWPGVRRELGAWLQDQDRNLFLLAPQEAPDQ